MLYDIRTTAAQLKKLGEWVNDGPRMADVELVADDRMLLAEQGDDRMAWDLDGSPASDEYLECAPLDGPPRYSQALVGVLVMDPPQLALIVRAALVELRNHAATGGSDSHTLDLVCDRWDEYEQEIGTDQLKIPDGS